MYDLVSELNASKTQVFECKQDCGRYLSFHCHMQSHSCEYCTCVCFTCLSSKMSHTTSKTSLVDKTTTAGIDVPAINASGTATDVMATADDSLAITAMEAVNGATTANDDPGAITSGAVDETATAGIDVPAVNTSGTATDVMVATDASPAIIAMESMNGAATANDDPGPIFAGAVHETATAGIDVPAINTSGTATDVMVAADDSPAFTAMESVNNAIAANDDPEVKRVIKLIEKCSPNLPGVQQADKYKFYLEHVGPCDLWYQDISLIETMFGCLPYDNRELIVHVFDCCNDKPFCVLFWNDPDDFKHWLIEIVQQETYAQMNRTG